MKKTFIKNLKTKALAILFCLGIVVGAINIQSATVSAAEIAPFGGYYETSLTQSVIRVEGIADKTVQAVSVNGESVDYTAKGEEITLPKPSDSYALLNNLTHGLDYTLEVQTDGGAYSAKFKCVTLAIRKASDLAVFNTDKNDYEKNYVDKGYYVLANDIEYDKEFKNKHSASSAFYTDRYSGNFGFGGIFDGQGYSMTYAAHKRGLFGCLTDATIRNVALIDIYTVNAAVLAGCATGKTQIDNVYCRTTQGRTAGLISFLDGMKIRFRNVITEFPNANSDYQNLTGGVGALFYFDENLRWAGTDNKRNFDYTYDNVYVISKCPLGKYGAAANGTETWEDYYLAENEAYIEGDAPKTATYVIENVKKYSSLLEMRGESNDYSGFDSAYWDLSYGVPLFKGAEDKLVFATLNGSTTDYTTIYTNTEENTCTVEVTLNTLPIGVTPVLEITEGGEFVSLSGNVVTAVADGKTKIKLTTSDGSFPETVITIFVRTETAPTTPTIPPASNEEEEGSGESGGCKGSLSGGLAGGAALLLCCAALAIRRRKREE